MFIFILAEATQSPVSKWTDFALMLLGIIVTYVLVPFLRKKAAAAEAQLQSSNLAAGEMLRNTAESMIFAIAANMAEKRFPELGARILKGELSSPDAVKAELRSWGAELRKRLVEVMSDQKIDIVAKLGDRAIDELIENAANRVSPFPGMETAKVILQRDVSDMLVKKGVDFVRSQAATLECKNCDPRCEGCKTT